MPPLHLALLATWVALPVLGGGAISDALVRSDADASRWWSVVLWALWTGTVAALAVPKTTTLTASRILVPAGGALGIWAALLGPAGAGDVAAATAGGAATVLVLTPAIGARFVDGSSYGDERRLPLRAPAALLLGPVELAWLVAVAGAVTGPALLLAGAVVPGLLAAAIGIPLAAGAVRSLHLLSRRWVVLVPAGLVLHDHLTLTEPVLFVRSTIAALHPAAADTAARDLSAGAPGLALELELAEPATVGPVARRGEALTTEEVAAVVFVPTLPGEVIAEAARRRIPVLSQPLH